MRLIALFVVCVLAGCATTPSGQTILDPQAAETIDAVAAFAEPLGVSLGILFPPIAAIGGILAGVAGAWRKLKPRLEEAEDMAEMATVAGEATSVALEDFKVKHPEEWADLSALLRDNHGPEVENFYRALRSLPPKG